MASPHDSARGGTLGAAGVIGGADFPEHWGPSHGFGGGIGFESPVGPSARRASIPIPIAGRSPGCRQSARLEGGAQRPIARSVRNAPAPAHALCLG
jgi:hypothetical protein